MSEQNTPTLSGALANMLNAFAEQLFVATPARIVTYDPTRRCVSVQPVGQRGYIDESGDRKTEAFPVIDSVPVVFLGGAGYSFTVPLSKGDGVLLLFTNGSIDQWLAKGGDPDPVDDRSHALSDAIAITGLTSFVDAVAADNVNAVITVPAGKELHAGGSASLATMQDVADVVNAISTAAVGGADGGATYKANMIIKLSGVPAGTQVLKGS